MEHHTELRLLLCVFLCVSFIQLLLPCSNTECPMVLSNSELAQNCIIKSKLMSSLCCHPRLVAMCMTQDETCGFDGVLFAQAITSRGCKRRQRKASTFLTLNPNHAVPFPRESWLLVFYATFWKDLIHKQESNARLS